MAPSNVKKYEILERKYQKLHSDLEKEKGEHSKTRADLAGMSKTCSRIDMNVLINQVVDALSGVLVPEDVSVEVQPGLPPCMEMKYGSGRFFRI